MRFLFHCLSYPFPNRLIGIVVFVIVALELALQFFLSTGFWNNQSISFFIKIMLAGLILISWISIAWIAFWYIKLVLFLKDRTKSKNHKLFVLGLLFLPIVTCINLYLICWGFRLRLNVFPTFDAFIFAGINANMLTKYFWQAERFGWVVYLVLFGLIGIAGIWCSIRISLKHNILQVDQHQLILKQMLALMLLVNVLLSLTYSWETINPDSSLQNVSRIDAFNQKSPPLSFELYYNINPTVTFLINFLESPSLDAQGKIHPQDLHPLIEDSLASLEAIPQNKKFNIILITIESLRSDVILKVHQGKKIMPNLAKLATEGIFFQNCYSTSTHSDYSDPSILSSLYPLRKATPYYYTKHAPWPKVLIYDLLKQHGYSTAMFSSQNETWSNMHNFYESENLDIFFDSRSFQGKTIQEKGYFASWLEGTKQIAGKLDDKVTINEALKWINIQKQTPPFFMSLNLQTSHFPYERVDGNPGPFQPGVITFDASMVSYPIKKVPIVQNAYFNALSYVDQQIGRLLDELERMEIKKRTMILITGDHGEAFYENGVAGHAGSPLETTTKVGFIFSSPGLVKSGIDNYLTQSIDIVPTALGRLGISKHSAFQGTDLLSDKRPHSSERLVYIHCCNASFQFDSIISGTGWKYIHNNKTKQSKLYFRPTDLVKHKNLIESYPKIANVLHDNLFEWRRRQLLYYNSASYYNFFYPPRPPRIKQKELETLGSCVHDFRKH